MDWIDLDIYMYSGLYKEIFLLRSIRWGIFVLIFLLRSTRWDIFVEIYSLRFFDEIYSLRFFVEIYSLRYFCWDIILGWIHKSHKAAAWQRNAQLSPTSNGCSLPPSINCPLENLRISIRQNLDDHTHSQSPRSSWKLNKQTNKQNKHDLVAKSATLCETLS